MNIMILGLATVIVLSILSWLYQFRGLPSIWIKLLLPLLMGIGMVIAWGDHIIIGFIYGAFIGLVSVPIMLAIKPKTKRETPRLEEPREKYNETTN